MSRAKNSGVRVQELMDATNFYVVFSFFSQKWI
jgi:hypothetical protein